MKEIFEMKEQYETPEMKIIQFDVEDIITTSNFTFGVDEYEDQG